MDKKNIFVLGFLISVFSLHAQMPQDSILYEGKSTSTTPYYMIYDDVCYKWEWDRKQKEFVLYKDTIQLPIMLPYLGVATYYFEKQSQRMYIGQRRFGPDYNYFIFDFKKDTIITPAVSYEDTYHVVMANSKLYYAKSQTLYIQNISTKKIIDSVSIKALFTEPYYVISEVIKFPDTNFVFFMVANQYYGDERTDEQYYVYDENKKGLTKFQNNDILKKAIPLNVFSIGLYDFSGKYVLLREHILNLDYEVIGNILVQYPHIYGFVLANGEAKQLIIKSQLDSKNGEKERHEVLIPFIPNPFREKAMYQIYKNIELVNSDLKQLDTFDLQILRNMIFAKHNYTFKDKFLQAYFNLYSFYGGNHDKNRLTDVSHLLTPIDKKNLELLQQVSKRKE
jgi:hypothetical protein